MRRSRVRDASPRQCEHKEVSAESGGSSPPTRHPTGRRNTPGEEVNALPGDARRDDRVRRETRPAPDVLTAKTASVAGGKHRAAESALHGASVQDCPIPVNGLLILVRSPVRIATRGDAPCAPLIGGIMSASSAAPALRASAGAATTRGPARRRALPGAPSHPRTGARRASGRPAARRP